MSFWEVIWFIMVTFAFVAYLMVFFSILTDLFRDRSVNGWVKAAWILALIILPFLTALVYVVVRGRGMAHRRATEYEEARKEQEAYIKQVAGEKSPADEIAKATAMYEAGTISADEYSSLKHKALAS